MPNSISDIIRGAIVSTQREATASAANRRALMKAGMDAEAARESDIDSQRHFSNPIQDYSESLDLDSGEAQQGPEL
jgi:hypothetical protein